MVRAMTEVELRKENQILKTLEKKVSQASTHAVNQLVRLYLKCEMKHDLAEREAKREVKHRIKRMFPYTY